MEKDIFGWEILDIDLSNNDCLCLRVEENSFDEHKLGEKRIISIEYFILKYLNTQSSKHKTIPKELFEFLK